MDYNYHSHTFRCNHATGTPEEYILNAIENGIKYMGFSDHFPYICRDGFEARYRVPVSQVKDYFDELNSLRDKYKDKIEIKIGFEMEYYPELFAKMFSDAKEYGAEFLILGQHFLSEEHPGGVYSMNENDRNLLNAIDFVNETKIADSEVVQQPTEKRVVNQRSVREKRLLLLSVVLLSLATATVLALLICELYYLLS